MIRPRTPQRHERIKNVLARRQRDLTLVLSNIHDPHNVSAIYRSCDAFGIFEVNLYYTDTAFPNLGLKSSGSARKWVRSVKHRRADEMMSDLTGRSMQVIATCFEEGARPLVDFDLTQPTAVIFGNEHDGVEKELLDMVEHRAYIPMQGMVQSLNVSVAAAVFLFEAWRQRSAAGMYDSPSFSEDELAALTAEWCEK